MSSTPSIPNPLSSDKDPPASPRPSHLLPTSHDSTNMAPPPPRRPTLTTRTPSFDPQPHILNPSPLLPTHETTSQSFSKSWQQQQKSESKPAPPQPAFSPFFTLINDTTTSSTYHPSRIHYIFSDDDVSEVLTSSLLNTAQAHENPNLSRESLEGSTQGTAGGGGGTNTSSSSSATFRKPISKPTSKPASKPSPKAREERVIIIDLDPTLTSVTKIASLSKQWQVLSASIERAPSFDPTTAGEEEGGEAGLMLKIEGVGVQSFADEAAEEGLGITASGSGSRSGHVMGEEEMQGLLEGFDRKMAVLRRVVEYAGVGGKEGE